MMVYCLTDCQVDIVGNAIRCEVDMGEFTYVYIPLSDGEADRYIRNLNDRFLYPCWRLRIPKQEVI